MNHGWIGPLAGPKQSRLEEAVHEALVAACLAHRAAWREKKRWVIVGCFFRSVWLGLGENTVRQAMDAPKKFPVESFLAGMRRIRRKFKLSAKDRFFFV